MKRTHKSSGEKLSEKLSEKESIVFAPLAQLYICNVFKSLRSPTGIGQFLKALRLAQVQDTGLVNFDI